MGGSLRVCAGQDCFEQPQQNWFGAHLQEDRAAVFQQALGSCCKAYRLAQMLAPVGWVCEFSGGCLSGHAGHHSAVGEGEGDALCGGFKVSQHRIQQGGVCCHGNGQRAYFEAGHLELIGHCLEGSIFAGEDHAGGPVEDSQCDLGVGFEKGFHIGCAGQDGDHAAAGAFHQLAPPAYQAETFFQAKDASRVCGGKVAQAVAQDQSWGDSPAFPQFGQGAFDGVGGNLSAGMGGPEIVVGRRVSRVEQFDQGAAQAALGHGIAAVDHLAEEGVCRVQFLAHVQVLGSLACKQKSHFGGCLWRDSLGDPGRRFAGQRTGQEFLGGGGVFCDHCQAMGEVAAADMGGVAKCGPVGFWGAVQEGLVLGCELVQCLGGFGGKGQQLPGVGGGGDAFGGGGCFCDDEMCVDAAESKGADAGHACCVGRPVGEGSWDLDGELCPRDMWVWAVKMQMGWNLSVVDRQDHFDQASHPGGRFQMADVGFDGADPQGGAACFGTQHIAQGTEFDGISQEGAGAMCLHIADLMGVDLGGGQGLLDQRLLCWPAWDGKATAAAVVVDSGAADHGVEGVLVGQRVAEPFEHHDAAAFSPPVAIGVSVEGFAASIGGHGLHQGEHDVRGCGRLERDTAAECQIAFAAAQGLAGEMGGDQRRGTGCAHRHGGAAQAQQIRQPPCGRTDFSAGSGVDVQGRRVILDNGGIVEIHQTDVDAGLLSSQIFDCEIGIFEGGDADLQQEAVLWIHLCRFSRGNPEKLGVKLVDLLQKMALLHGQQCAHCGALLCCGVPAGPGQLSLGALSVLQHLPESCWGSDIAAFGPWKAAPHADHSDRLVLGSLRLLESSLQLIDFDECLF